MSEIELPDEPFHDDPDATWDGYPRSAWVKPSLAVVACDGGGNGCVLWTAGPAMRFEIIESGLRDLSDLGLDDAPEGISVWAGRIYSDPRDDDSELRGEFRSPTIDEWAAIMRGECPWNDADWRTS